MPDIDEAHHPSPAARPLPAMHRPSPDEYAPQYAGYVGLVPEEDVLAVLERQLAEVPAALAPFGEERAGFRYAPGKWSVREVVGHVADSERVFSYRALRFARGDATPLAGFDQDPYVAHSGAEACRLADLAAGWEHLRRANLALFRQFEPAAWSRAGEASDARVTVRALVWITAGHLRHHLRVLGERYAAAAPR